MKWILIFEILGVTKQKRRLQFTDYTALQCCIDDVTYQHGGMFTYEIEVVR